MGYPDLPKIGDIVTWDDTHAGHGHIDGKVVSLDGQGVFVSMYQARGVHYALIPFVRITDVRTPKEKP